MAFLVMNCLSGIIISTIYVRIRASSRSWQSRKNGGSITSQLYERDGFVRLYFRFALSFLDGDNGTRKRACCTCMLLVRGVLEPAIGIEPMNKVFAVSARA